MTRASTKPTHPAPSGGATPASPTKGKVRPEAATSGPDAPTSAQTSGEKPAADPLRPALATLERSLEAPVVPGETEVRADGIRRAIERVHETLGARMQTEHRKTLREIGEADAALLPRVTQLEDDAEALHAGWAQALGDASALGGIASASPRDEAAFRDRLEHFAPATLALILRTRAHEAALQTWLSEALKRDRGIGD